MDKKNNLIEIVSSRRTIHNFKEGSVPDKSIIIEAIEAACWAPNHHLTEPWRFYLLGKETINEICELNKAILTESKGIEVAEKKTKRWSGIPGWIVVSCQKSSDELLYQEDYAACSCAIQNLMLILWQHGIGCKWSTGSVTRNEKFYDIVWINNELENIIGIIWYGYPAEIPQTTRKPLQQILTELP